MSRKFDLAGVSVMLAMPVHRDIPAATVASLIETQAVVAKRNIDLEIRLQVGSSAVSHVRTTTAAQFLDSKHTHLFWIDSDIVWEPDSFLRLLALATKLECVCAIYPAKAEPPTFFIGNDGTPGQLEANEYGCLEIGGCGIGFSVFQRKVIEELAEKAPKAKFPGIDKPIPYLFRFDIHNGDARGEDMAFFADVRALGYRINLDPTVTLGHVGTKEYRAAIQDYLTKIT